MIESPPSPADRFAGCLIGTAVGDSLLLPMEGLSRRAVAQRFPGPLRHRLVFGHGLVSDDTEHAFLVAQSLLAAGADEEAFARGLARRLRWWLIALPGGCGKATALGLLRSWCGVPPGRSGIDSAGNGPAMRAAIIGLRWADDRPRRSAFVAASTTLTHRDARALAAAGAVAEAAAWIVRGDPPSALWSAWQTPDCPPWNEVIDQLQQHAAAGSDVDAVAVALGCPDRVSGYALHSVPLALFAWLRHRHDATACLTAIRRCGGDTDTMGAIAGALLGIDGGPAAFPGPWRAGVLGWPMSIDRLQVTGESLALGRSAPIRWWWPMQPLRNLVFLAVVIAHVARRCWPFP